MRVPDLPGFLRKVAPVLRKRLAGSPCQGHTGELKINFYRDIGKTGDHALLTIQKNTRTMTVTGWNWSKKLREMLAVEGARTALYDIIASPEINKYQGNEEAKLNLVDIRKSI